MKAVQNDILDAIKAERARQDDKWGEQNHSEAHWLTILMEEVGEVCRAYQEKDHNNYIEELVQVAAVAVSMVESYYRQHADIFIRKIKSREKLLEWFENNYYYENNNFYWCSTKSPIKSSFYPDMWQHCNTIVDESHHGVENGLHGYYVDGHHFIDEWTELI